MCPTGYSRGLRALPDIVGAFVPIDYRRSLCALPVIVGALVPYRLTVDALSFIGLVRFFGLIWTKYKRLCTHF